MIDAVSKYMCWLKNISQIRIDAQSVTDMALKAPLHHLQLPARLCHSGGIPHCDAAKKVAQSAIHRTTTRYSVVLLLKCVTQR
jgi:hypothetical protein